MKTVIITGGTGLIGKRLSAMLIEKAYEVILFSHSKKSNAVKESKSAISYWNIAGGKYNKEAIAKADIIIHLAGANVADKRWTKSRKEEIVSSRTQSGALLVKALQETPNKVSAVIAASAIGWYGADTNASKQKGFKENALASPDFLGETCRLWEESIEPVRALGKRLVKFRTGIVLSNAGGAFAEFKKPLKGGIASILGSGSQVVSWIHIDDMCRMYIAAIEDELMQGVYNAVSPVPVTNKELVIALAKQMRGKAFLPLHVPAFALQFALGEMSVEVLKSATISADKVLQSGFDFIYPTIQKALQELVPDK